MDCEDCGKEMILVKVKGDSDSDIYYYQCKDCGKKRVEIVVRKESNA